MANGNCEKCGRFVPLQDGKCIDCQEVKMIKQFEKILNEKGFVCVGNHYMNGTTTYTFIKDTTGETMQIIDEDLDEEILWESYLQTTEREVFEEVRRRKFGEKSESEYTDKEEKETQEAIADWEDVDYKTTMMELIEKNKMEIKG